jgi:hypothetical protein
LAKKALEMTGVMAANVRVGTTGAKVAFICVAPAHLAKNGALVDHLTIHETDWAYCPSNVRTNGHDWKATGGLTMGELEVIVRGMRERAGLNGRSNP